jgi:hypothetical protein
MKFTLKMVKKWTWLNVGLSNIYVYIHNNKSDNVFNNIPFPQHPGLLAGGKAVQYADC